MAVTLLGDSGDNVLYADTDTLFVDGGAGFDTLVVIGSADFSAGSITGIEELKFAPVPFEHGFAIDNIVLSAAEASAPFLVTGDGFADHLTVDDAPGVAVDLSHWTLPGWSSSRSFSYPVPGDGIAFNGSSGADSLTINPMVSIYDLTLGGGSDTLILAAASAQPGAPPGIEVRDFQAGTGGDILNLAPYLGGLSSYIAGQDPFAAGFLRVIQNSASTLVQADPAGGGQSFFTLVTLDGVNAAGLTTANFGGFTPNLSGSVQAGTSGPDVLQGGAGSNQLDGGAGVDTVVYTGLLKAYASPVISGSTIVVSGGPEDGTDTLTSIERTQFVDGYLATGTTDFAAQVYRLYEAALGRASDPEGLANWTHDLMGGQSLVSVASGFVNALEFQAEYGSLNNPGYVSLLYHNVLGRAADASGLANWTAALDAGQSRAQVLIGFSESAEFISTTAGAVQQGLWVQDAGAAEVARLYDTVLGRLPDALGEINWTHALDSGAMTLLQITQGFIGSAEFQAVYGALDDSHFVQLLYQNALHRTPDSGGLANWTALLATGHSRAEVVVGFSESPEHIADTAAHIDQGLWFS